MNYYLGRGVGWIVGIVERHMRMQCVGKMTIPRRLFWLVRGADPISQNKKAASEK
jgi:hypothetical protein